MTSLTVARPLAWEGLAAVVWGGGIWSMHFVAMLAFRVATPVGYDPILTGFSLLLPIAVAWAGFAFVRHRGALHAGGALAIGAVLGSAIVTMHFAGVEAMVMLEAGMHHHLGAVYGSYFIAIPDPAP